MQQPPVAAVVAVVSPQAVTSPKSPGAYSTTSFHQIGAPEGGGWAVHRPRSTNQRLILPFYGSGWCGPGSGLERGMPLPEVLQSRGVTHASWEQLLGRLEREVQVKEPTVWEYILYYS